MLTNQKEMVKEIKNLIVENVNFSKIDYFNQPLEATEYSNYRAFKGCITYDFIDAKIKGAIYEVIENLISFELREEVFKILEKYHYYDWVERYEWVEFEKEFYIDLIDEILDDERVMEQIDYSVFEC